MATTVLHEPLVIPLTPEERASLEYAASAEHQTVERFALRSALAAAATAAPVDEIEEIDRLLAGARAELAAANVEGRDLLQELIDERRAAAAVE